MDEQELLALWRAEESGPAEGWDFSSLAGRMTESHEPWDLETEWRRVLDDAESVLDMGTGGGEWLLRFADRLPRDTVATEGWPPNVTVARGNLAPYGVEVVDFSHDEFDQRRQPMPFPDGRFDVVCNRHESYDPGEAARILCPGGVLLTQQVGSDEFAEIRDVLGRPDRQADVTFRGFRAAAEAAGLAVEDGAEHEGTYTFCDVAALVAYLQLVPWDVPDDFTVDRYFSQLLRLHHSDRPIRATRKRFWLRCRR